LINTLTALKAHQMCQTEAQICLDWSTWFMRITVTISTFWCVPGSWVRNRNISGFILKKISICVSKNSRVECVCEFGVSSCVCVVCVVCVVLAVSNVVCEWTLCGVPQRPPRVCSPSYVLWFWASWTEEQRGSSTRSRAEPVRWSDTDAQICPVKHWFREVCVCVCVCDVGEVVKLTDVKYFPFSLWLIFIICVAYYVAIFPFIGLGQWVSVLFISKIKCTEYKIAEERIIWTFTWWRVNMTQWECERMMMDEFKSCSHFSTEFSSSRSSPSLLSRPEPSTGTHTHTHTHAHAHTLSLTHTHTRTHTLSLSHTLTHTLSLSHTHTLSLSLTHTHTRTHTRTHMHTLSHTHSHTHSLSHTHTHTLSLSLSLSITHTHHCKHLKCHLTLNSDIKRSNPVHFIDDACFIQARTWAQNVNTMHWKKCLLWEMLFSI